MATSNTEDETLSLLNEANLKIARRVAKAADRPVWVSMLWGVAFAVVVTTMTAITISWATSKNPESLACERLALQVAEGDLSLDRYMATRCSAKHLKL